MRGSAVPASTWEPRRATTPAAAGPVSQSAAHRCLATRPAGSNSAATGSGVEVGRVVGTTVGAGVLVAGGCVLVGTAVVTVAVGVVVSIRAVRAEMLLAAAEQACVEGCTSWGCVVVLEGSEPPPAARELTTTMAATPTPTAVASKNFGPRLFFLGRKRSSKIERSCECAIGGVSLVGKGMNRS